MEFSRIDEDTVRCILTEQDMKERGIELEDFFKNKDKVHELFEEIVEEAKKEISYESSSGILTVQVMPLPENGLSILLSENRNLSLDGFLKQMKDIVNHLEPEGQQEESTDTAAVPRKVQIRVYRFPSLSQVERFVSVLPLNRVIKSQLLKNEKDLCYYLVVEKGRASIKLFGAVCEKAMEFSEFVSDDPRLVAYYREHCSLLIEKNAIAKLAGYQTHKCV